MCVSLCVSLCVCVSVSVCLCGCVLVFFFLCSFGVCMCVFALGFVFFFSFCCAAGCCLLALACSVLGWASLCPKCFCSARSSLYRLGLSHQLSCNKRERLGGQEDRVGQAPVMRHPGWPPHLSCEVDSALLRLLAGTYRDVPAVSGQILVCEGVRQPGQGSREAGPAVVRPGHWSGPEAEVLQLFRSTPARLHDWLGPQLANGPLRTLPPAGRLAGLQHAAPLLRATPLEMPRRQRSRPSPLWITSGRPVLLCAQPGCCRFGTASVSVCCG